MKLAKNNLDISVFFRQYCKLIIIIELLNNLMFHNNKKENGTNSSICASVNFYWGGSHVMSSTKRRGESPDLGSFVTKGGGSS